MVAPWVLLVLPDALLLHSASQDPAMQSVQATRRIARRSVRHRY
jgi:hypothetical protein